MHALRATFVVAVVLAILGIGSAAPASAAPLPPPKQYFGVQPGTSGELIRFSRMEDYFKLIAQRSPRVTYQSLGKTTLGHEYPFMQISSPRNLARVDEILAENNRLANPRGLSEQDAKQLAAHHVPVYYLEAGMHSTEVGPVQAMPDIVYRLANEHSPQINRILRKLLIVVVPAANPDGSHLVTDYFNETAGTDFTRSYPDLYHHYTGHDDNRDWFFFTQPESRTRQRLMQTYRPVVAHLMHQAGTNNPRMFTPPYADPLSRDIDPITISSANAVGLHLNSEVVAEGRTGVQWGTGYGIFFNADVAGYFSYLGTALVLTEIASGRNLAYPYSRPDGKPIGDQGRKVSNPAPYRGTTWTLAQQVHYGESAVYAGAQEIARNGRELLYNNLYRVGRNGLTWDEGPYAYVISADQRDPFALLEMLRIFDQGKVEIDRATAPFTAGGHSYPAGSYVLETQQPLGRWVDQLLKIEPYPDWARACDECPLIMPYSETTDNLGMLLGVAVDPVESAFDAPLERVEEVEPRQVLMPTAPAESGAYLVEPSSYAVAHVLAELQRADVPTFRAAEEFSAGGRSFTPGTVVVPPSARARMVLSDVSASTGLQVYASDQAPQVRGFQLKPGTRVGLVRGANNMPGGWLMWMFDTYDIDYEVVSADDYADGRLSALYDTIVLADGISRSRIVDGLDPDRYPPEWAWARGVGEAGWSALAQFVRDGGNLVAVGSAAETAQQLLDLPIAEVTPQDPFNIPGALLRVRSAPDVPAAWGMPAEWSTWFDSDRAFRVLDYSHATVATSYPTEGGSLLSAGYEQGADSLRGAADVISFDVGRGHATIAGSEITFRSWPRIAWTIMANAIYQGPSKPVSAQQMGGAALPPER